MVHILKKIQKGGEKRRSKISAELKKKKMLGE